MCCILLAPPFTRVGKENIVPRVGYLDARSGSDVHFYCAGYGGYWDPSRVRDMQKLDVFTYRDGTEIP